MRGILLDIEGTTTPISFVYETLFPYAFNRLRKFLIEHQDDAEIHDISRSFRAEHEQETGSVFSVAPLSELDWTLLYAMRLMQHDRKSTALKRLQGLIWQEGYREGALHGEVFPDVPAALEMWSRQGKDVRIFSSGSVLAQKLIFSTTPAGDLTRFLKGYFDTETGPKTEPSSYARIAQAFGLKASEILFVSDVTRELDAALAAGMRTLLAVRPGNAPQTPGPHRVISSFEEIS